MTPQEMAQAFFELCEIAGKDEKAFINLQTKISNWQKKYTPEDWGIYAKIIHDRNSKSS